MKLYNLLLGAIVALSVLNSGPLLATECSFPRMEPLERSDGTEYRFVDSCGKLYEVGYRMEGNTLYFPKGGKHTLPEANAEEAERVLRETYGLVGERERLIRTKMF